jgi:tRNA G18 (ribose-2'-O)-methylase SpoU
LREKKQYRLENQSVMVQGFKTVKELCEKGIPLKSVAITAKGIPKVEADIKYPALHVLKDPNEFSAEHYYITDINLAKRILGTSSNPGTHEIFAEVCIPTRSIPELNSKDRLLVFDQIKDPGNLGGLIRAGMALGWNSGLITKNSSDIYNDKTIRSSRALSLSWQHDTVRSEELIEYLKSNGFTPIVADMLPRKLDLNDIWSPEYGNNMSKIKPGTGVWFWNFQNKPKKIPKKMALILSSEHNGVQDLDNELKVSTPMDSSVESLNVAIAGSIIMNELNRYILS